MSDLVKVENSLVTTKPPRKFRYSNAIDGAFKSVEVDDTIRRVYEAINIIRQNPDTVLDWNKHTVMVSGKDAQGKKVASFKVESHNLDVFLPEGDFNITVSIKDNKGGADFEWFFYPHAEQALKELRKKLRNIIDRIMESETAPSEIVVNTRQFSAALDSWLDILEEFITGKTIKAEIEALLQTSMQHLAAQLANLQKAINTAEEAAAEVRSSIKTANRNKLIEIKATVLSSQQAVLSANTSEASQETSNEEEDGDDYNYEDEDGYDEESPENEDDDVDDYESVPKSQTNSKFVWRDE